MAACNLRKSKQSNSSKKHPCVPPEPLSLNKTQTINEATICHMCTKRLVTPKLLPCFHTLCLSCLKRRCKGKAPGDFVKCPICYSKFIITEKGVEDFQPDFVAEFLIHAEDAPEKEKRAACESCPAESDGLPIDVPAATTYCMDCSMKLCEDCSKPHTRLRGKNHRILTLGKQFLSHKSVSSCDKHSDGMHQKFCFDCQANICEICHTCKFDKAQAMCQQIADTVTAFMQQLEDDNDMMTSAIGSIQGEVSRLHREKTTFVEDMMKTEAAIMSKGDEVKKLVDLQVESVLEDLAGIKSKSLEKLAWSVQAATACVLSMRGFQNFANLVKTEGTPYIISRVAEELNMHSRAKFLLKWQQDAKNSNYHTPRVVFSGADVESYLFTNADKGSLIGRLSMVDYMPAVKATVLDGEAIVGIAVMKPCLYVLRQNSSEVEVYSIQTFKLQRRDTVVRRVAQAKDMTSDHRQMVLYIADYKKEVIHRVGLAGANDQTEWPVGLAPGGVSVALDSCNLLVSCSDARKLVEFSAQGYVLREVCLRDVVALYHAVTIVSGQIVASVGCGRPESPFHRVCYVDTDGKTGHGNSSTMPGFTMVGPGHLAAVVGDESSGHVLVGDCVGSRVVLLSAALCSMRVLATRNHGLRRVWRIAVDAMSRRIYVADNVPSDGCSSSKPRSGRVMVFSF